MSSSVWYDRHSCSRAARYYSTHVPQGPPRERVGAGLIVCLKISIYHNQKCNQCTIMTHLIAYMYACNSVSYFKVSMSDSLVMEVLWMEIA